MADDETQNMNINGENEGSSSSSSDDGFTIIVGPNRPIAELIAERQNQNYGGIQSTSRSGRPPAQQFTLPAHKSILSVDIDNIPDKYWRNPGVHLSHYFNYGLHEHTFKQLQTQMDEYRCKMTMQNPIPALQSDRPYQPYHDRVEVALLPPYHSDAIVLVDEDWHQGGGGDEEHNPMAKGNSEEKRDIVPPQYHSTHQQNLKAPLHQEEERDTFRESLARDFGNSHNVMGKRLHDQDQDGKDWEEYNKSYEDHIKQHQAKGKSPLHQEEEEEGEISIRAPHHPTNKYHQQSRHTKVVHHITFPQNDKRLHQYEHLQGATRNPHSQDEGGSSTSNAKGRGGAYAYSSQSQSQGIQDLETRRVNERDIEHLGSGFHARARGEEHTRRGTPYDQSPKRPNGDDVRHYGRECHKRVREDSIGGGHAHEIHREVRPKPTYANVVIGTREEEHRRRDMSRDLQFRKPGRETNRRPKRPNGEDARHYGTEEDDLGGGHAHEIDRQVPVKPAYDDVVIRPREEEHRRRDTSHDHQSRKPERETDQRPERSNGEDARHYGREEDDLGGGHAHEIDIQVCVKPTYADVVIRPREEGHRRRDTSRDRQSRKPGRETDQRPKRPNGEDVRHYGRECHKHAREDDLGGGHAHEIDRQVRVKPTYVDVAIRTREEEHRRRDTSRHHQSRKPRRETDQNCKRDYRR